jgi:hypothetical protein
MKQLPLLLCLGVLALHGRWVPQNSLSERVTAKSDARIAFTVLKTLAGSWTGTVKADPPNPDIDGPVQVTLRVGSHGNVLLHEILSGGLPEPTTIYVEGDRLLLVHYCDAGNRPRLMGRPSSDQKSVQFDFVDISGSQTPLYLHDFAFTMISADHHMEEWTFVIAGDKRLKAHADLARAK